MFSHTIPPPLPSPPPCCLHFVILMYMSIEPRDSEIFVAAIL